MRRQRRDLQCPVDDDPVLGIRNHLGQESVAHTPREVGAETLQQIGPTTAASGETGRRHVDRDVDEDREVGCQAAALARALRARLTFEPGATPVGARLRELLLNPDASAPSPRAEALLVAADRAEPVAQVLTPALGRGEWVVHARYAG